MDIVLKLLYLKKKNLGRELHEQSLKHIWEKHRIKFGSTTIHTIFFFLRRSLTLSPRLEYSSMMVHCHLCLPDSRNPPTSASQVTGITGAHYHTWLIFVFLVEMRFRHVGQVGLELLSSSDPPASASHGAGVTGVESVPGLTFHFLTPLCHFMCSSQISLPLCPLIIS